MRMKKVTHWRMGALAAGLCLLSLGGAPFGCGGAGSHVEQGEAYSTGNADYDAFFKEVVETHALAQKAQDEQGAAREPLTKALGLKAKADVEETVEAAQTRAKKLHDSGVSLHLQLTPEPRMLAVQGGAPIGSDGEELIKAVEESTRTSIELSKKLGALPDKCAELEKKRADLRARSQEAFKAERPVKRREIDRELDAAADVLADASSQSTKYAGNASKFVLDLARAVETGGAAAALAEASAKARTAAVAPTVKPAPGRWRGAPPPKPGASATPPPTPPKGIPPRGTAAAERPTPPPARPTKPASGGDDFEP